MTAMMILDTEADGLITNDSLPPARQPRIVEVAAKIVDPKTLKVVDTFQAMFDPKVQLTAKFTEITGITQDDVKGLPSFAKSYVDLCKFFLGVPMLIAHNVKYDAGILKFALMRIDRLLQFPWPPIRLCTVEATHHYKGHRLSLERLHEHLFDQAPKQEHRAMADVDLLLKCLRRMKRNGESKTWLDLLGQL